jgi:hypothetical protein
VRLSAAVTYPVRVWFETHEGTAKAPGDFAARSGKLRFAAGKTTRSIGVAVRGDRHDEGTERMTVRLSKPVGARILDGSAVGTIRDNDP